MNLGTPIRLLRALPTRQGRLRYSRALRGKLWDLAAPMCGDSGVPALLLDDIPMILNPKDKLISRSIFESGSYEPAELRFLRENVQQGMVAVDVGANIGAHSMVMGKAVGPAGSVHSFEPSQAIFWLRKNICRNQLERTIVANEMAVGSYNGTLKLHKCSAGNEAFTSASQPLSGGTNKTFETNVTRLDDYAKRTGIGIIDFLKIDVEGHEGEVFKGCETLFSEGRVSRIMFEVNNSCLNRNGERAGHLINMLRNRGFSLNILSQDGRIETCPDEPQGDWTTIVGSHSNPH